MDKKEILDRAKKENMDEGKLHARSKGQAAGCVAVALVFIFIAVWKLFFTKA